MAIEEDQEGGFSLPGQVFIGQVGLRVGSLDDVIPFYRDIIGLSVDQSDRTVSLSAREGPSVLALQEDPSAPPRGSGEAGLFHTAIRVPDRPALADALGRIRDAGYPLTGGSDHLVSEAIYLSDPEGNGLEIYYDKPRDDWPRTDDGRIEMATLALNIDDLAMERQFRDHLPVGTDIGHVHLEVTDIDQAEEFYETMGFRFQSRYGNKASFVAAGDYHHHIGLNVWNGRHEPIDGGRGLTWIEFVLSDASTLGGLRRQLKYQETPIEERSDHYLIADPDGIELRITISE